VKKYYYLKAQMEMNVQIVVVVVIVMIVMVVMVVMVVIRRVCLCTLIHEHEEHRAMSHR